MSVAPPILAAVVGTLGTALLAVIGWAATETVTYARLTKEHAEAAHDDAKKSLRLLRGEPGVDGDDGLLQRVEEIEEEVPVADGGRVVDEESDRP